ncbi:MAG: hypothetical protein JOS17DRAFT_744039 [Linnemannia elongata]|nr:MAG: hypothetical protein JOS17DRAFT_744039 [Linnemannia elongata]
MPDAFERFFNMTELVDHLTPKLAIKDVSRLARTSRKMHKRCTPSLFRTLADDSTRALYALSRGSQHVQRLFESTPALLALSRNSQHVRELNLQRYDLAFYYNCLLTFQDINSHLSDMPTTRPSWLPPPDVHSYQLVALPPMTRLSRLTVDTDRSSYRPYKLPSAENRGAILAQLTWLISLSPRLTSLSLQIVSIADMDGCCRLENVIAGLHAIKSLELLIASKVDLRFAIFCQLFFSCPSSLQHLRLNFDSPWDIEGERGNVVAVARRQEPLINLKDLSIRGIYDWNSATDIRSIFTHCPNINKLSLSIVRGHQETDEIEQYISQQCPKIESLDFGDYNCSSFDPFPFRIMESLPSQQITEFVYSGMLPKVSNFKTEVAFHRHLTTLRYISIHGKGTLPKALFPTISKECCNLNMLIIMCECPSDSYITLDDALQTPWTCTKLTHLNLAISGCELPVEPGVEPYYLRPTPITLTEVETQHFSRLENLYRQIGSLTALQKLELKLVSLGEQDTVGGMVLDDWWMHKSSTSFPAMLNLRDTSTNRPGFLHHLSGLKRLRELHGSVSAETDETEVTMGWAEAKWMDQNWPELQQAEFFTCSFHVSNQFRWLEDKRTSEGLVPLATYICF